MEDQVLGPETVDLKRAYKSDKTDIRATCSNYLSNTLYKIEPI